MPNALINETSPYLLQHANNPVNWLAWNEESLKIAKKQNKPILVSIGYSSCHWCHVMEHESFMNEQTAGLMNRFFVNIKIDREERPDLDHIYMDAVQAITGSGGWPLNVFLTPDLKPFYGGTYFPPVPAHGRPSWNDVIVSLGQKWEKGQQEITDQANSLFQYLSNAAKAPSFSHLIEMPEREFKKDHCEQIKNNLLKQADKQFGGFGRAPKFLQTFSINYLLNFHLSFKDEEALQQAELSLKKMLLGGIYDHAGGGISRYSTDNTWHVPHFEKMLYDNALILSSLCTAYQITGDEFYKNRAIHILTFLKREMRHAEGGYFSALDADSDGIEGAFYVWQKKEILEILGEEEGEFFCKIYNVTAAANWEEGNILYLKEELSVLAKEKDVDPAKFQNRAEEGLKKLLDARASRNRPGLDDKVLIAWNALFLKAIASWAFVLNDERLKEDAASLADWLLKTFWVDRNLFHTWKNGKLTINAFLDDHAYFIEALIEIYQLTGNEKYLQAAGLLTENVLSKFSTSDVYFSFSPISQADNIVQRTDVYDGAVPSANGVMAFNLARLGVITENITFIEHSEKMVLGILEAVVSYPGSFGNWGQLFLNFTLGWNEIKVGYHQKNMMQIQLNGYRHNNIFVYKEDMANEWILCKNRVCYPMVKTWDEISKNIRNLESSL